MPRNYVMGDFDMLGVEPAGGADGKKILETQNKFMELKSVQQKVDAALKAMPAGTAKDRLMKLRNENRGTFTKVVLPAYEAFQKALSTIKGWSSSLSNTYDSAKASVSSMFGEDEPMGILPLIPFAVAASATAALGYVGKSAYVEYKILNDPALSASQRVSALQSSGFSALGSTLGQAKSLIIWGAVAFVGFKVYQNRAALQGAGRTLASAGRSLKAARTRGEW